MYPNPLIFDPERFDPRPGVEPQPDPRKWVFGFGRRVGPCCYARYDSIYFKYILFVIGLSWSVHSGFLLED
jgi:hypothetical protein